MINSKGDVILISEQKVEEMLMAAPNENDHWDFKEHWHEDKGELLRDILNFVNTVHHEDCYIIFGISDKDGGVVGVENDVNRKNRQQLQDFLRRQKLAQNGYPETDVDTYVIGGHDIDVLTIYNNNDVPFFLKTEYRPTKGRKLQGGLIYSRIGDSNTPRDESTTDSQMERLWRKRFNLDVPVNDRFIKRMMQPNKWSKMVDGEITTYIWDEDPSYVIKITPDQEGRKDFESFAYSQVDKRIGWDEVGFFVNGTKVDYTLINYLDGARLIVGSPDLGIVHDTDRGIQSYYYLQKGDLNYYITEFLYKRVVIDLGSTDNSNAAMEKFKRDVVIYDSAEEKANVEQLITSQWAKISHEFLSSEQEIQRWIGTLSRMSSRDNYEWKNEAIYVLTQHKITSYINQKILPKLRDITE